MRFFAHSLAASTYYYSGKFEEALTEINYALEFGIGISAGDLSRVYYFRGLMQESTFNNPPAALADYDKALELDSSNYSALSDRAKVLSLLFRYEEAFEAYNTRIEIYPDSADAYSDRAIFLCEMGYFEEALPDILYAVELAPQDPYFGYDLGLCYAHMQEYENSIEAFSDVINMNPEYVHAYIDRAMVYLELEDYEKAQQDLLQALEIDDSMPRTYGGLELTCIELKQWEEGLEYSRIARELDYELVMVTNQDGLGTDSFPEDTFWPAQNKIIQAFENEGIKFSEILIDKSFPEDNAPTRKPRTGLLTKYIHGQYDLANSYVIGDRATDIELAKNLGSKGIFMSDDSNDYA